MKTNPNESVNASGDHRNTEPSIGITKREYFASQAMIALYGGVKIHSFSDKDLQADMVTFVKMADFLIEALNKTL